ncbi:hypothetical protein ACP275_13G041300 [Erythranthe tilingii]
MGNTRKSPGSSKTSKLYDVPIEWILSIGNRNAEEQNDGAIEIPPHMLISDSEDSFRELIQFVYPDLLSRISDPSYFKGRVILAATNESVDYLNNFLLSLLPGEDKTCLSADSICQDDQLNSQMNEEIYPVEFLNTLSCSGLPPHNMKLKVGVPVMLIRTIDQAGGLCEGTMLTIVQMGTFVLNCKIISGKKAGDMAFIPRMTMVPSNSTLPFRFQRRQYPLVVSFATTINKSQVQTLSHVGVYLPRPASSHSQLYTALSKVKTKGGIKVFIKSESG